MNLAGSVVLVVEDEPIVALDIVDAFESEGAIVVSVGALGSALKAADEFDLCGAVVDHGLQDGDSSELCRVLKDRNVPFILYSGFAELKGDYADVPHLQKPVASSLLVTTMKGIMKGRPVQL